MAHQRGLRRVNGSNKLSVKAKVPEVMALSEATMPATHKILRKKVPQTYPALDSPTLSSELFVMTQVPGATTPSAATVPATLYPLHMNPPEVYLDLNSPTPPSELSKQEHGVVSAAKTRCPQDLLNQQRFSLSTNRRDAPRTVLRNSQPLISNIGSLSRRKSRLKRKGAKQRRFCWPRIDRLIMHCKGYKISAPLGGRHCEGSSYRPLILNDHLIPGETTSNTAEFVEYHHPDQGRGKRNGFPVMEENCPAATHPVQIILSPAPDMSDSSTSRLPIRSSHPSNSQKLTIADGWKIQYQKEHRVRSRVARQLQAMESDLTRERARNVQLMATRNDLEKSLIAYRTQVSRQQLYIDYYKELYEAQLARTEVPAALPGQERRPQAPDGSLGTPCVETVQSKVLGAEFKLDRPEDDIPTPRNTVHELSATASHQQLPPSAGALMRPEAGVYQSGYRRIPSQPVYRVRIPSQHEPTPAVEALLKIDRWEWCSVPALELIQIDLR